MRCTARSGESPNAFGVAQLDRDSASDARSVLGSLVRASRHSEYPRTSAAVIAVARVRPKINDGDNGGEYGPSNALALSDIPETLRRS